jgi:hypothetical protein
MKMLCVFAAVMLPLCLVSCASSPPAAERGDAGSASALRRNDNIYFGDNSSEWAYNGECDDPYFTGPGAAGKRVMRDRERDAADCQELYRRGEIQWRFDSRAISRLDGEKFNRVSGRTLERIIIDGIDFGEDNGRYTLDGECDDPRFSGPGSAAVLVEYDRFRDATDCSAFYQGGWVQLVADTRGAAPVVHSGQTQQGQLAGGAYPDRYRYQGSAGAAIVVDLAADFIPFLTLVLPSGERLRNRAADFIVPLTETPNGGHLPSKANGYDLRRAWLNLALTETGEYQVEVASYFSAESGAYTLKLNQLAVSADHEYTGVLDNASAISDKGKYIDTYTFEGTPGQFVSIELGSDDFGTLAVLGTPDGVFEANEVTPCYEGCQSNYRSNSWIWQELSVPGTYTVRVSSYEVGETGAYHLRIVQSEVIP